MLSLVLMKEGSAIVEGLPEYYVSDEDFSSLLHDKEKAAEVFSFFGQNVCIGRLGALKDGVYDEENYETDRFVNSKSGKGMSFYEKVL